MQRWGDGGRSVWVNVGHVCFDRWMHHLWLPRGRVGVQFVNVHRKRRSVSSDSADDGGGVHGRERGV